MLTVQMLTAIMPALPSAKAAGYLPDLVAGMLEFHIDNELRAAAYLSQLAEESMQLTHWEENLNYSAQRMTEVWPGRFPNLAAAQPYAHNPEALANKVYGGRLGNTETGDGWKFRGRMPMQATGRNMYELLSELTGLDLVTNPDLCMDPAIAFRCSAAIFARVKNCNQLADGLIQNPDNFTLITKRINGGTTGLAGRLAFYKRARAVLPDNLQINIDETVVYGPTSTATTDSAESQVDPQVEPTQNTVGSPEPEAAVVPKTEAADGDGETASRILRIGDKGEVVRELQTKLGLKADGDFGPNTHAAVIAFQAKQNIQPDGVVGPKTWAALG